MPKFASVRNYSGYGRADRKTRNFHKRGSPFNNNDELASFIFLAPKDFFSSWGMKMPSSSMSLALRIVNMDGVQSGTIIIGVAWSCRIFLAGGVARGSGAVVF